MFLTMWPALRRFASRSGGRQRGRPGKRGYRPCLERLEERRLLSAGDLDPTFGSGGKVVTDFLGPTNDTANDVVAVQANGKIVVVGTATSIGLGEISDFALARYNPDGSLDATFGSGGRVTTDFGSFVDRGNAVALQADGKIVVAGQSGGSFGLARYNPDGSLDTTFDADGTVTTDFTVFRVDVAFGVAIQADGKIVAAGSNSVDVLLARYNPDGSLDSTFGTGGKVITDFGSADVASALAIQVDGSIVVAGQSAGNFLVARYKPDGSLDTGFGNGGRVGTDFGFSFALAVVIQGDGKIVASGGTGVDFALARYNSDGSLDAGFDSDGKVNTDFGSSEGATSLALQADGKIVVAGVRGSGGSDFALARYNSDGRLDTSFDTDGKVTTDFGSFEQAFGVAIQADGKIVAAGFTFADFALARYNPNGSPDASFDTDGKVTTTFFGPANNTAGDVAIQADGKIVVVGSGLARYNANGSLDTSFGTGGKVTTDFGSATAVALQADGKIVVVGQTVLDFSIGSLFAVARYNPDGSLDSSFGTGGKVTTAFGPSHNAAFDVVIQADGKIVAVGDSLSGIALARYNLNGSLDTSFDADGMVTTSFGTSHAGRAVALQADGKIVAAGLGDGLFALARYNPDGSPDASFDADGKLTGAFFGIAEDVAIQADGKIVAVGTVMNPFADAEFALARFNPDGSLDTSFDADGRVITNFTDFTNARDSASAVVIQADGRILAVGSAGGSAFALARYNPNGSPDILFGVNGRVITDFGSHLGAASGVAMQADGKIIVAGTALATGSFDFALARYVGVTTPNEGIMTIVGQIQALAAAQVLNNGQANSLLIKLQGGIQRLDQGNNSAATNLLQAFVSQIQAFINGGVLTPAQGQPLIDVTRAIINQINGSPLHAAGGQSDVKAIFEPLTSTELQPLVVEAAARWEVAGPDSPDLSRIEVQITDLPGALLGLASGNTIWLDINAAGWGWFVDLSPWDDSEFLLPGNQGEERRMDLLTVIAHELGHVLGLEHEEQGVMAETLAPGTREMPNPSVSTVDIRIANLGGATLGLAAGHTLWLDANAAGWGWFVDPTPWDDVEFADPMTSGAAGRMDLLTVVMHELGHLIGRDSVFGGDPSDLMAAYLGTGIRRLPTATEAADIPTADAEAEPIRLAPHRRSVGGAAVAWVWDGGPRRKSQFADWLADAAAEVS